ncbi:hypothetical protein PanWU01x14_275730 [Parasponia andersonii]|uniref:Uncharacterized protein n=1 Tax=Parasponia andersonii TaxID=3476 RepID=A0A2P5B357_PARAD|nr:hypothetical protein PanWU01x14_275730 [Parasponia andersonii]
MRRRRRRMMMMMTIIDKKEIMVELVGASFAKGLLRKLFLSSDDKRAERGIRHPLDDLDLGWWSVKFVFRRGSSSESDRIKYLSDFKNNDLASSVCMQTHVSFETAFACLSLKSILKVDIESDRL